MTTSTKKLPNRTDIPTGRRTTDYRERVPAMVNQDARLSNKDIFDQVVAISSVDASSSHRIFLKNSVRHRVTQNDDIDGMMGAEIESKAYPREHW